MTANGMIKLAPTIKEFRFLNALSGVVELDTKRKIIGKAFIDVLMYRSICRYQNLKGRVKRSSHNDNCQKVKHSHQRITHR